MVMQLLFKKTTKRILSHMILLANFEIEEAMNPALCEASMFCDRSRLRLKLLFSCFVTEMLQNCPRSLVQRNKHHTSAISQ